jgi:hypothetical protein
MQQTDRAKFCQVITSLAAAFRVQAEPALIEGYWAALEDLPLQAVEKASTTALRESDFFPRPVELRRRANAGPPGEATAEAAGFAWAELMRLARNSRSAKHPDPIAEEVVRKLGGWLRIGQTEEDKLDWMRKNFIDLYEATAKRSGFKQVTGGEKLAIGPGRDQGFDDDLGE